ncbi:Dps family protein [Cohnella candidum]|uniref:DNA starvation/stationary phase protection protein n=1 Tax=Cohnella candidum TaxID=2674991 RepID=A0A3G3K126_9BACL|nr:DNA starvation/stationary phase protection protein [Cohnella candidum]AYQ74206.1 DNA starvation/stationary phase protection protein [Cohnella candidum]
MAVKEKDLAKPAKQLQQTLNEQLANWSVAYFKLHHFHWYVKGPHFPVLHAKFEELYNLSALKLDELAERMLAIGLEPASTMKEYLSLASIKEGGKTGGNEADMLEIVVADFEKMAEGLKEAGTMAEEEAEDGPTADLLYGQVEELQKQIWMLKATLGK